MDKNDLSIMKDDEYKKFISILKEKVRSSQLKAAIKVNYELLDLYWNLGKEIVEKQKQYSWGDSFLKILSADLKKEFPDIKGFSPTNLKHIRYWFNFYNDFLIHWKPKQNRTPLFYYQYELRLLLQKLLL